MTLNEILEIVGASRVEDWNQLAVQTHYKWQDELPPNCHNHLAVYKPDIDISIAYGADLHYLSDASWAQNFIKVGASCTTANVRYRGQPIDEKSFAFLDEFQYLVPSPRPVKNEFHVKKEDMPLGRLMFAFNRNGGPSDTVEGVLERAGVKIV